MTDSLKTSALLQAAVARLLAYVSDAGDSLTAVCASRVFIRRAPDDVVMPYVVVLFRAGATDPEFNNLREEFDLECQCVASDPQAAELVADLAENALLTWRLSSTNDGLTFGHARTARETLPVDSDASIRDRVEVRTTVSCISWPRALSDAITP